MSQIVAILFAVLAGGSTALESFINGELGKNTSPLIATFISLVVGAIFFLISIFLTGNTNSLLDLSSISPKFLLGGIFGGFIIYFTTKAIPGLGLSNTLIVIVVSQILIGFFMDIVVLKEQSMHLYKYIGAILLFIGTFFIVS
ncbi:DMT family transporter [Paeniclostridium sp. NSJ-45]|uniref:DMT family transporter n=1 Tax=Paeniclostridium hominis TaxID=2764329 RepID=A0ABR7K0Z4_9FIRM|nr:MULTISPECIES: DMT family transporter [Paeniclostridium]MBC6002789.1 DMT family transporter [Paeniclostridium hominis]